VIQHTLAGQFIVDQTPDGEDVIVIQPSPFEQYVIPIPDTVPEGAPPDALSARELLKRHLNKGVVIPSGPSAIVPGR
jgi:hypothetical protein